MRDDSHLSRLKELTSGQFKEVVHRLGVDPSQLPGRGASRAEEALALIQLARQGEDGDARLSAALKNARARKRRARSRGRRKPSINMEIKVDGPWGFLAAPAIATAGGLFLSNGAAIGILIAIVVIVALILSRPGKKVEE